MWFVFVLQTSVTFTNTGAAAEAVQFSESQALKCTISSPYSLVVTGAAARSKPGLCVVQEFAKMFTSAEQANFGLNENLGR